MFVGTFAATLATRFCCAWTAALSANTALKATNQAAVLWNRAIKILRLSRLKISQDQTNHAHRKYSSIDHRLETMRAGVVLARGHLFEGDTAGKRRPRSRRQLKPFQLEHFARRAAIGFDEVDREVYEQVLFASAGAAYFK